MKASVISAIVGLATAGIAFACQAKKVDSPDRSGGVELRYTVEWERAVEDACQSAAEAARVRIVEALAEANGERVQDLHPGTRNAYAARVEVELQHTNVARLTYPDDEAHGHFTSHLMREVDDRFEVSPAPGRAHDITLPEGHIASIRDRVLRETRDSIAERIEAMGFADAVTRVVGGSHVLVQIPGAGEDQVMLIRDRLGDMGQLAMRVVDRAIPFFDLNRGALEAYKLQQGDAAASLALEQDSLGWHVRSSSKAELVRFVQSLDVPRDRMIGYEYVEGGKRAGVVDSHWRTHFLHRAAVLTGGHVARAEASFDDRHRPMVLFELNSEGARLLGEATERNVHEYLAVMLDEDVLSAPLIEEKIAGGRVRIAMGSYGGTSEQFDDALALSRLLHRHAFPAPVRLDRVDVVPGVSGP